MPQEVRFETKGEIALGLIDAGLDAGVRTSAVVADAGYGGQPVFLDGLEDRGLPYAVGVPSTTRFRDAGQVDGYAGDEAPAPRRGRGRPRKPRGLAGTMPATEAGTILEGLGGDSWRVVAWRKGTRGALRKLCARTRVYRSGAGGAHLSSAGWLIGERPMNGDGSETKCYFVWGADEMTLDGMVELVHSRWIIERFYQDAKGEVGLDDYEGRLWSGFHHHVALCMLAHCYLALQQDYGPQVEGPGPGELRDEQGSRGVPEPTRGFPP